jgi:hypothetical protein
MVVTQTLGADAQNVNIEKAIEAAREAIKENKDIEIAVSLQQLQLAGPDTPDLKNRQEAILRAVARNPAFASFLKVKLQALIGR